MIETLASIYNTEAANYLDAFDVLKVSYPILMYLVNSIDRLVVFN